MVPVYMTHTAWEAGLGAEPCDRLSAGNTGPTGPSLGVWWSWKQNKRLGTETEDPHTHSRRDLRGPSPSSALGDRLGQKSSKARVWGPKISLYLTCLGQKAVTRYEPAISRDEDS